MDYLLHASGLNRKTYYYQRKKQDKDMKNDDIMNDIIRIFYENNEKYGHKRITQALRNEGRVINRKKVLRLMKKMNLNPSYKYAKKYISYRGEVGKTAANVISRNFESDRPLKKLFSDVTEFNCRGTKVYLSPVLDGYNREIVSFDVSLRADLTQTSRMLDRLFEIDHDFEGTVMHTDQGWQYQHASFVKRLKERGMIQSMSRKGNCLDNCVMEGFFGLMKNEMFYGHEDKYKTPEELIEAIKEYIYYYNNERIKLKLKGLSPVQYRIQSFPTTV